MSKKYPQQTFVNAVNSELDSKLAAKLYNVPASTIRRHRQNSSLRNKISRPSYLSSVEESYFSLLHFNYHPIMTFKLLVNLHSNL